MIAALTLAATTAQAALVTRTVDLCVELDTAFNEHGGDTWIQDLPRNARGFAVTIKDYDAGGGWRYRDEFLDEGTGCLAGYTVRISTTNYQFSVFTFSNARMRGIDIESWEGESPGEAVFESAADAVTLAAGAGPYQRTVTITEVNQVWRNLLVATMVFKDVDWNTLDPVVRDCCSPEDNDDGTCSGGTNYTVNTDPIQMQTNPYNGVGALGCCQSRLVNDATDLGTMGVHVGVSNGGSLPVNMARKFTIAHELGHVLVKHRMGGQEADNETPDGCDAGGIFHKAHMTHALREGWAWYVAAATWNAANETDCDLQMQVDAQIDVDLDGDSDPGTTWSSGSNTRTIGGVAVPQSELVGLRDCSGDPHVSTFSPTAMPNHQSYVEWMNWLDDVEDGSASCAPDGDPDVEAHRSSIYDFVRLFWDLQTGIGGGLTRNQTLRPLRQRVSPHNRGG